MPLTLSGTNGVSGVDGSAGTPASQGSDTNTGIVYGADAVSISTGGVIRASVNSDGQVVVSAGTASLPGVTTSGDTNTGTFYPAADTIGWATGGLERFRIDSSGTPMFNTTSQLIRGGETFRVQLNAGIASFITTTGGFPVIALRNSGTNGFMMAFNNATTECGTISSSGNNVAYNTSSDYRLKENIKAMTGALEKIAALKPVTFNWKSDGSDGQGFIAHELQSVVPDAVTGEKDAVDDEGNPRYQGVDTSFLVATLTAAIQELSAKLDAAVAEIEALKGAK
jgi:hypothetical protein